MRLGDLIGILEQIAPIARAEPWDNVGLLVGDPQQDVSRILLTIDFTPQVAAEAKKLGVQLVIAYHPPIFHPIKRLTSSSLIWNAIRDGIGLYSPHTALDVADGGTNDMLADVLGMVDWQPLRPASAQPTQCKLVVFVPQNAVDRVSQAIFDAGAGEIGNYRSCGFQTPGTGTFFGNETSQPMIGKPGKLEQVSEIRLETILPINRAEAVITAMRKAHPYEEPAFDLLQLATPPSGSGMGRLGPLQQPATRPEIYQRIKAALHIDHLLVAGPQDGIVRRAAVCAGACGEFVEDAIAAKVDLFLTGEMRHHEALKAAASGLTVVCTLHSNSERAVLTRLRDRIRSAAEVSVEISKTDRDPFSIA